MMLDGFCLQLTIENVGESMRGVYCLATLLRRCLIIGVIVIH